MIYAFVVRSVLEYACPVWFALPEDLSDFIELVQKKGFRTIFPGIYNRVMASFATPKKRRGETEKL